VNGGASALVRFSDQQVYENVGAIVDEIARVLAERAR
jgi:very-short-patch-repair endonuclease